MTDATPELELAEILRGRALQEFPRSQQNSSCGATAAAGIASARLLFTSSWNHPPLLACTSRRAVHLGILYSRLRDLVFTEAPVKYIFSSCTRTTHVSLWKDFGNIQNSCVGELEKSRNYFCQQMQVHTQINDQVLIGCNNPVIARFHI
jgi:hypothetical protein